MVSLGETPGTSLTCVSEPAASCLIVASRACFGAVVMPQAMTTPDVSTIA